MFATPRTPSPEAGEGGAATGRSRVVIVEDEGDIAELVAYSLRKAGEFAVRTCGTGEEGLEACFRGTDLVILDLNLPGVDGIEVCRRLRKDPRTANLPILMLTARASERDRVRGLDLGADDYVTKPFSVRELVARVKALLRRSGRAGGEEKIYERGDLRVELEKMRVTVKGKAVTFTRKEWGLLRLLVENRGRVLSREIILRRVWGEDFFGVDRTVDVHVRHLRRKLGRAAELLETVIGVGYRWRE